MIDDTEQVSQIEEDAQAGELPGEEETAREKKNAVNRKSYAKKKKATATDRRPTGRPRSIKPQAQVLLSMAGSMWIAVDDVCGAVFQEQTPALVDAIDAWAKTDQRVYEFFADLNKATGPLAVAVAGMPIAFAVFGHHVVPALQRRREALAEQAELPYGEVGTWVDDAVVLP